MVRHFGLQRYVHLHARGKKMKRSTCSNYFRGDCLLLLHVYTSIVPLIISLSLSISSACCCCCYCCCVHCPATAAAPTIIDQLPPVLRGVASDVHVPHLRHQLALDLELYSQLHRRSVKPSAALFCHFVRYHCDQAFLAEPFAASVFESSGVHI